MHSVSNLSQLAEDTLNNLLDILKSISKLHAFLKMSALKTQIYNLCANNQHAEHAISEDLAFPNERV